MNKDIILIFVCMICYLVRFFFTFFISFLGDSFSFDNQWQCGERIVSKSYPP